MASARQTRLALVGLASTAALGLGGLSLGSSPAAAAVTMNVNGTCALTVSIAGMSPGQTGSVSVNVGDTYKRAPLEADGEGMASATFEEGSLPDGTGEARYYSASGENGYETESAEITIACDDDEPTPTTTSTSESPTSTSESPTSTDDTPTSTSDDPTDPGDPTGTDTDDPGDPTGTDTGTDDPGDPTGTGTDDPGDPTGTDTAPPSSTEETTSGPNVDTGVVGGDDSSNGVLALAGLATVGGVAAAGAFARRRLNDDDEG